MNNKRVWIVSIFFLIFVGCFSSSEIADDDSSDALDDGDITNAIFTNRSGNCSEYIDSFSSSVTDVNNSRAFTGSLTITVSDGSCIFTTNSIPNHNFNDGDRAFANDVAEVDNSVSITTAPVAAGSTTAISLSVDNAIFLNGAKLDIIAAACYGVGDGKVGCNDAYGEDQYWRYDPMHSENDFGTDSHNAHAQPTGAYHYHGDPQAMYDTSSTTIESPTIGFAADGFPIFGPYFDNNGTIEAAESCYVLKSGEREDLVAQVGDTPGGSYDGTYIQDYEFDEAAYDAGTCDLDRCNGMTVDGVYGYYVTDGYPWVMKCFTGTPDSSFNKN